MSTTGEAEHRQDGPEQSEVPEATVRKAVGAAAMGNLVEWFDYGIYSYVTVYIAASILGGDNASNVGLVLALFAVAYLVRPFGGIVLGPLGDRIGRKKVLAMTIVTMSGASFLLGCLPTFSVAGWGCTGPADPDQAGPGVRDRW